MATPTMDTGNEEELDLSAGMVPHHNLGPVTGYDHDSGLPIVKRETKPEESEEKPAKTESKPAESEPKPEEPEKKPAVGDKDPTSGRDILQPHDDPAQNQQAATAGLKEILPALEKIVAEIPGVTLEKVRPEKDSQRTGEKIQDEGKPAATIGDYAALRVSVDSLEDNDKFVEAVKKQFPIARTKDELEQGSPEESFHAMVLQVQAPNQSTVELQILPREQSAIAEDTHPAYVQARGGDQDAKAELKKQNDGAMEQFTQRNAQSKTKEDSVRSTEQPGAKAPAPESKPQLKKGQHVLLQDGRSGSVEFHDHKVTGNARVRSDDGEHIKSIPGNKLTAVNEADHKEGEPYVAFDLDKTLAKYGSFHGPTEIGKPIPEMVDKVKEHLAAGDNVRIMTARVSKDPDGKAKRAIQAWSQKHIGTALPVTDKKDEFMTKLYDDKAVAVEPNTGKILGGNADADSQRNLPAEQKEGSAPNANERSHIQPAKGGSSPHADWKSSVASRHARDAAPANDEEKQEKLVRQVKPPKGHTVVQQHFRKLPS